MSQAKNPADEVLVRVRVLKPIAQLVGPCLVFGMEHEFPKRVADRLIARGDAELATEIDLKAAVMAIKQAGGEISFQADNVALMKACEELDAAGILADVVPAQPEVDGETENEPEGEPAVDMQPEPENEVPAEKPEAKPEPAKAAPAAKKPASKKK